MSYALFLDSIFTYVSISFWPTSIWLRGEANTLSFSLISISIFDSSCDLTSNKVLSLSSLILRRETGKLLTRSVEGDALISELMYSAASGIFSGYSITIVCFCV